MTCKGRHPCGKLDGQDPHHRYRADQRQSARTVEIFVKKGAKVRGYRPARKSLGLHARAVLGPDECLFIVKADAPPREARPSRR